MSTSIDGVFSVNILFQQRDDDRLKVVQFEDNQKYASGKIAVITGTAGTGQVSLSTYGATPYKNASGNAVSFSGVERVAFIWSGDSERLLSDEDAFRIRSSKNRISISDATNFVIAPTISSGVGTGTYTIVIYGT